MKKAITICAAVLLTVASWAAVGPQIPQKMSYQAVIRDGGEALIKNQQVGMKISILQGSQTGTAVYVETQTATTNTNGLVSLKIGDGTVVTGNFSTINWASGSYYIKTETDPTGGTDYTIVGTSELMSVPYALYSSGVPYGGASSDVNLGTHSLTANSLTLGGVTYPNNAGTSGYFLSTNGDGIAYWAAVNSGIPYTGAYRSVDLGVHGLTAAALNVGAVTYPNAHGTSGQVLSTTGSGTLSWTTPASISVPYTGATDTVDLGAYDLTVNGLTVGKGHLSVGDNTAIGNGALHSNTTGDYNTATGAYSLYFNTTGYSNTATGQGALNSNTTGHNNTANGTGALNYNITGNQNTATGKGALQYNLTGSFNTANGLSALETNESGSSNTAYGVEALVSNTTGDGNTAIGVGSLSTNTSGSSNTAIGANADVLAVDLTNATAIGSGAIVAASNTIQLGNTSVENVKTRGTITAGDVIYPNVHGTSGQVLSTSGSGTLSWTTPDSISIGTIGGSSNAKGATVTSGVLSLTPADVTNGGIVTTETQTFAGDKTVNGNFTASKFLSGTTLDKSITTPGGQSGAYTTCWQSFTAGTSGFLSKVSMDFKNCAGTGTLSIYRGQGNYGTVLTSQSFSVSTIGNEIFQDFLLNSPVYVTNGNEYTIAFVCSSGTINEVVSADFYPGSQYLFYNGSSWPSSPSTGSSILFKTYLSQESGGNITAGGTITAGAVTYPNAHGTNGQVLSTTGSGILSWTTPSTTATAYSGILPVTNGGTGTTTSTGSGNVVLSSSPTLVSPALGTPSSGVATYLTGLPLTTGVTGTLPVANGGTGQITKAAAFDALSPMTTPGDIIYGGTSGTGSRLGHGTSGQVLSTTGSGTLSWTTPASISVGAIGGSSNANAATITSGVLSLTPADGTNGGVITTGTQAIEGAKTFNMDLHVNGITVGMGAGSVATNTATGLQALNANTTGYQNTANGFNALFSNTTGNYNTANGSNSLALNTTGRENSAYGVNALNTNTTGPQNTAYGNGALTSNTTGSNNTAIGYIANVASGALTNATAIGNGAIVAASNTIQLGNTSVTNVKTSGTLTAGAVTYPNAHGTSGQVLSTTGSGTLSWVNPQSGPTGAQGPQGPQGATGAQGAAGSNATISMGAIGAASTDGATITSGVLSLSPANATNGGIVTTAAQTIAGDKTLSGNTSVGGILQVSGNTTIAGSVGIGTATPNASAQLELSSTTKGFLPPRMTQLQRDQIPSVVGLMIYNTTTNKPNYYNGTEWKNFDETSAAAPLIGTLYQGGIIAYILQSGDPGYIAGQTHGLIAAASDQSTGAEWGCGATVMPGADGIALGTGNQNTIDIMVGCATAGIAARLCGDLVLGGYSDWYLPSKAELNKLYINLLIVGGFSTVKYWSSSEYNGGFVIAAGAQSFANGVQYDLEGKGNTYYVRAVRAF